MAFNVSSLLKDILAAVKPALAGVGNTVSEIGTLTKRALREFADKIVFAGKCFLDGTMTEDECRTVVGGAMAVVLAKVARVEILVKAKAQKVIDAAIGAIKGTVNAAVGLALL